ncbi:MAG: trehalose-phosphatase [Candidatus Binataceae bacterium]
MSKPPLPSSQPTENPAPMPRGLLPAMLSRGRLLLCLDYDGTLSEIVPHPADARPLDGVGDLLAAMTKEPKRLSVAIVTGREITEVQRMLGVQRDILFSGTHGLETVGRDGKCRVAPGAENGFADLEKARAWLARNLVGRKGFVIEDKKHAIAMHYRMADPVVAQERREALRLFVESETPRLRILKGNKIDELLPRGAGGKDRALRALLKEVGPPEPTPVYFGDDTTDEDAFREIRDNGVGVLVGATRPSWARYRVDGPRDVARLLQELAEGLVGKATPRSP